MRYIRRTVTVVFILVLLAWGVSGYIFARKSDDVPPVITADLDSISISVNDGEEGLKKGLKAEDNKDGDITEDIIIGKETKFVDKGTTNVEFIVFDSSNNVGSFTRSVEYTDYVSPYFTLSEPLVYNVGKNVTVLDRISAIDCVEGNITNKLKIVSSDIDKDVPGIYSLGVEVSNKFGDVVSVSLPVNVVEGSYNNEVIDMDNYMAVVEVGEEFDPWSYISSARFIDGTAIDLNTVEVVNDVDTSTAGVYQVRYYCYDYDGRNCMTSLTVEVRD